MKCPVCRCHIEPKLNVRTLLTVVAITLLIAFMGGIFFSDWKMTPKFEQRIEKDNQIKKELRNDYVPIKPESKKKGN